MEEQKMNQWKRTAGRFLAAFLVIMVAGTVISHAADSFLVAQVMVDNPGGKSLNYEFGGIGKLVAEKEQGIYPPSGFIVEEILVGQGDAIEEGMPLLRYETGGIEQLLKEKESEWADLDFQYRELAASSPDSGTQAASTVDQARRTLERAEEDLAEAEADLELLRETSEQDLLEAKTEELAAAKEAVEEAEKLQRDGLEDAAYARKQKEEAVEKLKGEQVRLEEKIDTYIALQRDKKSKFSERTAALEALKVFMYGGSEAYRAHLDEVTNMALAGSTIQLAQLTRKDTVLEAALKAYAKLLDELAELQPDADPAAGSGTANGEGGSGTANGEGGSGSANGEGGSGTANGEAGSGTANGEGGSGSAGGETGNGSAGGAVSVEDQEKIEELQQELDEKWEEILVALYSEEGLEEQREKLEQAEQEVRQAARSEEKTALGLQDAVEKADAKWKKIADVLESIQNGEYDYRKEVESGEAAVKQAVRAVEDAKQAVKDAKEQDKQTEKERAKSQQNQAAATARQLSQAARKRSEKEAEMQALKDMLELGGIYYSKDSGIVTQCLLTAGSTYAGGQAAFRIGTGKVVMEAFLDKDAEGQVDVEDPIDIQFKGKARPIEGVVADVSQAEQEGEECLKIIATLPEGTEGSVGREVAYSFTNKSDFYDCCVPLSALHEDNTGYYVFVVRERDRILGKEQYAVRVPVTLIDKDGSKAAVSGNLSSQDSLIVSASRSLSDGDRVRQK